MKKAGYDLRKVGSSSLIALKRVSSVASIEPNVVKEYQSRKLKLCSTKFCNGLVGLFTGKF